MQRVRNFLFNIGWLAEITGNRISAVLYLLKLKLFRNSEARGQCGHNIFHFRKPDLSGLKEVLIDQEYNFLAPAIKSKKDFLILDCGAHIGLPILWALTINPELRALSVEASPDTFQVLLKNRDHTHAQWRAINRACWSDDSEISFSTRGDSMSHRASKEGTLKVKGITLPELMNMIASDRNVDLMKVDIEGAEEEFLCSHEEALNKVDRLVIELHPNLCNTQRVEETLKKYFTKIEVIQGRISSKPLLYCQKN